MFLQAALTLLIERLLNRNEFREALLLCAERRRALTGLGLRAHQRRGECGLLGAAFIKACGRAFALQHCQLLAGLDALTFFHQQLPQHTAIGRLNHLRWVITQALA